MTWLIFHYRYFWLLIWILTFVHCSHTVNLHCPLQLRHMSPLQLVRSHLYPRPPLLLHAPSTTSIKKEFCSRAMAMRLQLLTCAPPTLSSLQLSTGAPGATAVRCASGSSSSRAYRGPPCLAVRGASSKGSRCAMRSAQTSQSVCHLSSSQCKLKSASLTAIVR